MTKPSIKKLSVLGLVLIAASAVTAAILPSKTVLQAANGERVNSTTPGDDTLTCIPDPDSNPNDNNCVASINPGSTFTTAQAGNTSADVDSSLAAGGSPNTTD